MNKSCRLRLRYRRVTLTMQFSLAIVAALFVLCDIAYAQPGRGMGRGRGMTADMRKDMTGLHAMFAARNKITRTVKMLPAGAEAITESDDAKIATLIKQHVPAMESRVHDNKPLPPMTFHPIFVELIKHADDYTLTYKETKKGMKVTYNAKDQFVIMLVQEHAKLVSRFVKNGMAEIHKPYKLPQTESLPETHSDNAKYTNPVIRDYGKVVKLSKAAQQPRASSKMVVDVTKGGDPSKLNPAIEKLARFVNIYGGAGAKPARADMAIVLHGEATLVILKENDYRQRFKTASNPNLECLGRLQAAGVRIYVCGQSLIGKGARPEQVIDTSQVAVSALTSLVNLQADGYAYVPLK